MTILYSLVARGKTVLAEYTFTSGNFPTITRVLLGKIDDKDAKMSYVYDQHVFHYIVENKRRIPFGFLEDIKQRFQSTYGERAQTAIAFAMSEDFSRTMRKQVDFFNGTGADSFSQVNTKLDDVKNIMVQNIEMVLERGEKLELLVDKTEQLQSQAFKFEKSSKELKMAMFWRRVKLYFLIGFIVVFLLWLLTSIICGFDYSQC
jgi:vesicle-associated membrane protein 7